MIAKYFTLIVLLCINCNKINGQNEVLSCVYSQYSYYGYTCDLTIKNLNGLNNFQYINGTHINGKSDSDVTNVVFAYGSNSTSIPSIICEKFKNSKYFTIESKGITEINEYSFPNCENLVNLRINFNNIKKVYKNAFSKNLQLEMLSILVSEIITLPVNVFPGPGNKLTFLSLAANKIKVLKPEWFENLVNLTTLDLRSNEIEELPLNIFAPLKNLQQFLMGENKLKVLSSKSFFDISKVSFEFHTNQLNAIDENFEKLINFKSVFYNNICINIYDCFENFRNLENGKF